MRTEPTSMPTSPASPEPAVRGSQPRPVAAKASAAPPEEATHRAAPSVAEVRKAVEQANKQLVQKSSELSFQFDDELGAVVVKLIDTKTQEVLRQIPSPEALAIAKALAEEQKRGALLRADA